jgi:predicted RecB family endonuclease
MSEHSASIQAGAAHGYGETLRATYMAACLCGWQASQVYRRQERAARAFARHIAEARG